ncbi:MAG: peptidylprolyl isomerase [Desulfuromonadales bacterium]|nr:peptidylprolyl isomerase [Desulfuromonadales bacterium]
MNTRHHINRLIGAILLLLLLGLGGCQQQEPLPIPLPPLLKVGVRQLTQQQFVQALQETYPDISVLAVPEQLQLKEQLLKQLIDRELILGEASRLNVKLTPDEFDAATAEIRGNYSEAEFATVLGQMKASPKSWFAALRLRLLTAKVSNVAIASHVQVGDKETETYYLNHREEFHRPVEIRARQMLFKTRSEADRVLKLLKGGASFAELAKQYSQSPDRERGGALGYFSAGVLPEEFDQVLFKLPVQQVSEAVESSYGFHLFLVERKRRAGIRSYAVVKDEIKALIYQQKEEIAFHNWLKNLQATTKIEIDRKQL